MQIIFDLETIPSQQPDAREGVLSFLERRPPKWTMSKSKDLPAVLQLPPRHR